MRQFFSYSFFSMLLLFSGQVSADQIFFANGDRLTADIISQGNSHTEISSPFLGKVSVENSQIEKIITAEMLKAEAMKKEAAAKPKKWSGQVNAGFDLETGNNESMALTGGFAINRKIEKKNEFNIEANFLYGEEDKAVDDRKYDGLIRYAYSFLESRKAYHFFKVEGDHDFASNIDKRFTPSTGLGYWFADTAHWKAMVELGAGVTFTDYIDETASETEIVLIPRIYLEKQLIGQLRITEELIAYPSMTNTGEYRLENELQLKNPITDKLDLVAGVENEYNSQPGSGIKKHDMRLTSGLEYRF